MLIVASPQSLSEFPIFVTARGPGVTGDGEISINLNNYLPLIRLIGEVLLCQRRNQLKENKLHFEMIKLMPFEIVNFIMFTALPDGLGMV